MDNLKSNMLVNNDVSVKYSVNMCLTYEDGLEYYSGDINVGDIVSLSYIEDYTSKFCTGRIVSITPVSCNESVDYGSDKKIFVNITLDSSLIYESNVIDVLASNITSFSILSSNVPNDYLYDSYNANPTNFIQIIDNASPNSIIYLENGYYKDTINIDKPLILKGSKDTIFCSENILSITSNGVILEGISFLSTEENSSLTTFVHVNTDGSFAMRRCTLLGNYNTNNKMHTAFVLDCDDVEISDCIFHCDNLYNTIEFGISISIISPHMSDRISIFGNKFLGKNKNNHISMCAFNNNAIISIYNNFFEYSNNTFRISDSMNNNAYISMMDIKYDNVSTDEYVGLIVFQDYSNSDDKQCFNKIHIKLKDIVGPGNIHIYENDKNSKDLRLYYVYDNQDGIIDSDDPDIKFIL